MAYASDKDRKAYHREWYAKNKARRIEQIVACQKRVQERLSDLKLQKGCEICGYNRCARALEFHHRDDESKEFGLSDIRKCGLFWAKILTEVEK